MLAKGPSPTDVDLHRAGLTRAALTEAHAAYAGAGLDLARVPGRGWRLFGLHPTQPRTLTRWGHLHVLITDRAALAAEFRGWVDQWDRFAQPSEQPPPESPPEPLSETDSQPTATESLLNSPAEPAAGRDCDTRQVPQPQGDT
jgi:hypothetical protein